MGAEIADFKPTIDPKEIDELMVLAKAEHPDVPDLMLRFALTQSLLDEKSKKDGKLRKRLSEKEVHEEYVRLHGYKPDLIDHLTPEEREEVEKQNKLNSRDVSTEDDQNVSYINPE